MTAFNKETTVTATTTTTITPSSDIYFTVHVPFEEFFAFFAEALVLPLSIL